MNRLFETIEFTLLCTKEILGAVFNSDEINKAQDAQEIKNYGNGIGGMCMMIAQEKSNL